jgi:hypothetical protein
MLYPNAKRLSPSAAKQFFKEQLKPRLPRAVAMPNDGRDTLLRQTFSAETEDLLALNIQHSILLSL